MANEKLKLDQKAIDKINKEILSLKKEISALLLEQGNISKRLPIENWFMSIEMQNLRNDILLKQSRLFELEHLDYELIEEHHQEGIVDINKTYKLRLDYTNGKSIEKICTLITGTPEFSLGSPTTEVSIKSPLGNAIIGKDVRSTSIFKTHIGECQVTILEEINEDTAESI